MHDEPQRDAQERDIVTAWREAIARADGESPPPALDAAILDAAHAAVRPAVARRPRYALPLALAASLVVAVGLGLRQQRDGSMPPAAESSMGTSAAPSAQEDEAKPAAKLPAAAAADSAASDERRAATAGAPASFAAPRAADAEPAREAERAVVPPRMLHYEVSPDIDLTDRKEAAAARARDEVPSAPAAAQAPHEVTIDEIRALLARGERGAAAELARRFSGPLPADLRALLLPVTPPAR